MHMVRASLINIRSSKPRRGNGAALVIAAGIQHPLRSHCPTAITGHAVVPILLAFMDDETTQKTTDMVEEGYVAIKNAVLKYVNRVVPHSKIDKSFRGSAKMQVDSIQESWQDAHGVTWTANVSFGRKKRIKKNEMKKATT